VLVTVAALRVRAHFFSSDGIAPSITILPRSRINCHLTLDILLIYNIYPVISINVLSINNVQICHKIYCSPNNYYVFIARMSMKSTAICKTKLSETYFLCYSNLFNGFGKASGSEIHVS
jgi:hypothetical protein